MTPFLKTIGQAVLSNIPAIGQAAQGRLNRKQSEINQDKTIQANKEMAEYQYAKDLEMWNRANEFNSPEAQMSRIEKAGLNKNMVYGTGTITGNSAGTLPKYQAPRLEYNKLPSQLGSSLGMYQDIQLKNAQIDQVKAQTALTNEQKVTETFNAMLRNSQGLNESAKSAMSQMLSKYYPDMVKEQLRQLQESINLTIANTANTQARTGLVPFQQKGIEKSNTLKDIDIEYAEALKQMTWLKPLLPILNLLRMSK